MAIMGCNLDEAESFSREVDALRDRIQNNEGYRHDLLNQGSNYKEIKKYFQAFTRFLQYKFDVNCNAFYRVRRVKGGNPYLSRKDLIYPEPSLEHKDRMNNTSFRVLYASFHEFTAMAESRIDKDFIGKKFQLTRFSANKPLRIYRLGLFGEIYMNSPRDSDDVKR